MIMLEQDLKTQLAAYLERLREPVEIVASLDDSANSRDLLTLLKEITGLSPLLSLRLDGSEARRPSFAVARPGQAGRIHFAGLPLGHEFNSLVLALLHTGGHPPKVNGPTLERLSLLRGPLRFETYISLACHNCPDVVQALNLIAAVNPEAQSVMIDGALFQDEVNARQIMGVPFTLRNGEPFGQGRMSLEDILDRLDTGGAERAALELSARAPYDMLVVGGGPAGATAAIYAARKGLRVGLVAERLGGQVLDTLGIENFISMPYTEGPKLAAALEEHVRQYGVDLIERQRASALVPAPAGHEIKLASGASLKARAVVLATGARWRELKVPGEKTYQTKGVCFCPHCDGPLFKGKRVAVIGGGNSGVEAAIDLAGIAAQVTLLEFDHQLRADAVLQEKLSSLANVRVMTSAQTSEVLGDGQKVTGLAYTDRVSGAGARLELDGIFVQIGLLPSTEWLKGTVELSRQGEIVVDARGATSLPGVFAAGDCTTVPYKQIVIALGEGAKASLAAFEHLLREPPSQVAAPPRGEAALVV